MGAFFTNIQLKASNINTSSFRDNVIEYLIQFNSEQGFVSVDNEDAADKTILILTSGESPWLSIYDEELEYQNLKKMKTLSSELSGQFNTTALSVLVNDSDSMYVGLYKNGILKDRLSNLSKEIDFNKNKPTAWNEILQNNHSFNDIKTAWQNKSLFVEDFLTAFAKLVDIDTSKLLTGYNYLNEEKQNDGVRLNFARTDKKAATEPGPTKFGLFSGTGFVEIIPGEKYKTDWTITNQGKSSNGIDIIIAGEFIEQGSFIPETVTLSHILYKSEHTNGFTSSFIETVATTGQKIYYARFEDVHIPEGVAPAYPMTLKESKQYTKRSYDSAIKFEICFTGQQPDNGGVAIFFSPLINPQTGSYCAKIPQIPRHV